MCSSCGVSFSQTCSALPDRYGKSDETIRRWKRNPKLNFPKPAATINGRDYYGEADLEAWETSGQPAPAG